MDTDLIKELFKKPAIVLKAYKNPNPGVDFKFHTTYGHAGKSSVHTHEFYEVFLTIEGNVVHCVNKTIQILEPGCLVFIRPQDVHGYIYNEGESYKFVNLAMGKELFESMKEYIFPAFDCNDILSSELPNVSRLTKTETASLLKKLNNLNLVDNSNTQELRLRIRILLLEIFSEYFLSGKRLTKTNAPLWLEETCRLMKKPENFISGFGKMTEISGKTPEHLSRSMKKYLGILLKIYYMLL